MMRSPVPTSYRDLHGHEEEKNDRMTSFRSLIEELYVSLKGYTWLFHVYENACVSAFCYAYLHHI